VKPPYKTETSIQRARGHAQFDKWKVLFGLEKKSSSTFSCKLKGKNNANQSNWIVFANAAFFLIFKWPIKS